MSGKDIDGWYRNSVYWDPVTGMNQQQKTAVAYEAKAAGLVDSIRAMEMTGEDDPEGMLQRVRRERLKDAELQAQMQQIAQGGQGGQAPPGQPPAQQGAPGPSAGMPGGGQAPGNQAPPPMIMRPRGLGQPPPEQAGQPPKGVSIDALKEALKIIADRLKGSVAAVGELARNLQAQHITLIVGDYRDTQRVMPIVRALDPKAEIKVVKEADWPRDAVRVA
jgi:hypothetical protein